MIQLLSSSSPGALRCLSGAPNLHPSDSDWRQRQTQKFRKRVGEAQSTRMCVREAWI